MAGLIAGDVAGAIVSFFRKVVDLIVEAIRWIKQGIIKLYHILRDGLREAIRYEREIAKESVRFLSRHEDLAFGVLFAILFDTMGVNS